MKRTSFCKTALSIFLIVLMLAVLLPASALADPTEGTAGSGSEGTVGSGTEGTAGSGSEGTAGSGTEGTVGSGTEGSAGSGTEGSAGSGTEGSAGSGTEGSAGSGSEGTAGSGTEDPITDPPEDPPAENTVVYGAITVSVNWDAAVPAGTTASIGLNYACGENSGSMSAQSVSAPTGQCVFDNVPVSLTNAANETVGTFAHSVTASAGTGFDCTVSGLSVSIKPAVITTSNEGVEDTEAGTCSLSVMVEWRNMPTNPPACDIMLTASNGLTDGSYQQYACLGDVGLSFDNLPEKDGEGNALRYALSASSGSENYTVALAGMTLVVTYVSDEDITAQRMADIRALLDGLPAYDAITAMDRTGADFLAVSDSVTRIYALYQMLPAAQQTEINTLYPDFERIRSYIQQPAGNGTERDAGSSVPQRRSVAYVPQTTEIEGYIGISLVVPSGALPSTVTVYLYRNGTRILSKTVGNLANYGNPYGFGKQPACDANGVRYQYTVRGASTTQFMASTSGWDITFTEQNVTPTINIDVAMAAWDHGTNPVAEQPTAATVRLYYQTSATGTPVEVTGQVWNWTPTSGDTHSFSADVVAGRAYFVQQDAVAKYDTVYSGSGSSFTITNTYNGDKVAVKGKITWVGADYQKPDIVLVNDKDSQTMAIDGTTDADNTYVFPDLPTGAVVSVQSVPSDYTCTYSRSGTTQDITLTRIVPLVQLAVRVKWRDEYNKYGKRPREVTLYLYRDGKLVTGSEQSAAVTSYWQTVFTDLPAKDPVTAREYKYTVRGEKVPHYYAGYKKISASQGQVVYTYGKIKMPKVGDPTELMTPFAAHMYARAASEARRISAQAWGNGTAATGAGVDFTALKKTNKDVVAWLTMEGTGIDYPIVKCHDNTKYLTRLFSGEVNNSGTLFMDCNNHGGFNNRNTVIYGHNMKDGSMFAELLGYQQQSYYDSHKTLRLQTPNGNYTVEPVAAAFIKDVYDDFFRRNFAGDNAFLAYMDKIVAASDFDTDVSVGVKDKIITLVTCSDNYEDGSRYVVTCRLTPEETN